MIVQARQEQIEEIMCLLKQAKARMHASGIPQWSDTYPDRAIIHQDILGKTAYVYMQGEKSGGYFVLSFALEASYGDIQNGQWRNENPYGVIHRLALADGMVGQGIGQKIFSFAKEQAVKRGIYDLRIDTHAKNIPMQKALQRAGFQYCGVVMLADGGIRNAYQAELSHG